MTTTLAGTLRFGAKARDRRREKAQDERNRARWAEELASLSPEQRQLRMECDLQIGQMLDRFESMSVWRPQPYMKAGT